MRQVRKAKQASSENASPEGHRGAARAAARGGRPRVRIVTAVLLVTFVSLVTVSTFFKLSGWVEEPRRPNAAIVDQLSLTQPNAGFVEAAARTLLRAGYSVDYYPGEEVTVDFFRNLALQGYELIVLRAHSSPSEDTGAFGLFTSEPYSRTRYVGEQRMGRFGRAHYYDGGDEYFAIYPGFVESTMRGRFDNAVVVVMGCSGPTVTDMAEALIQKGAKAVVSWSGPVSANHTDAATERLLQHLLAGRLSVGEAVAETMAEVGTDPTFGSSLVSYPPESVAGGLGGAHLVP